MSSDSANQYSNGDQDSGFYTVEKIMNKKKVGKQIFYQVKWKGWDDPSDLTWQPVKNLDLVYDLIQEYEQKNVKSQSQMVTPEKSKTKQNGSVDAKRTKAKDKVQQIVVDSKKQSQPKKNQEPKEPKQKKSHQPSKRGRSSVPKIQDKFQISRINNFVIKKGKMFYHVDAVLDGMSVGVQQVSSQQLKKNPNHLLSLVKYLQDFVLNPQNWNQDL